MTAALKGEWAKVVATLSPKVCAVIALALGVGLPVLIAFAVSTADATDTTGLRGADVISGGAGAAATTLMVMAVIAVAAEYRFGMIRTTLAATPRRLPFFAAKLVVLGVIATVVGALVAVLAFVVTNPVLASGTVDRSVDLGDPGVARMLVAVPLTVLLATLIAAAVAFLVRSPAAGIAIVVLWSLVLEPVFTNVPWLRQYVGPYLPFSSASQLLRVGPGSEHALAPWTGFAVGTAWTAAFVALAAVVLTRRDA